jgi:hypothetical protein
LVVDYRKWPGFNTPPGDWARGERTVQRPAYYFVNTPQTLSYRIERPSQLDGDLQTVVSDVEALIRERQQQAAIKLAAEGRRVAGVKAIVSTSPLTAPTTAQRHGDLDPQLAAGGDSDVLFNAAQALRAFRSAYRHAWKAFKQGLEATFPGGTLLMRRRFRVECAPLDACFCQLAVT